MGQAFLIRWIAALILVLATFNPTSFNFFRWASANYQENLAVTVLIGLILAVAYAIYFRATFRSIGYLGIGLVVALVAALVWVLYDIGWLTLSNTTFLTWLALIVLSLVMGVGLTWSIIRRRLSGQLDVDDVDQLG